MPGLEGMTLGPYRLKRLLGQGGMAEVYLAEDVAWGEDVALKIVEGNNPEYLERLRREAEAIDKLQHKHILPIFDYDDQDQWHYMVMLYAPGGTLRERLKQRPLTTHEAAVMLEQIGSALQFAHDHGVLHRDVKPSNILLQHRYHAYLADFGLARVTGTGREVTQTGLMMGTPEYMAPDLAEGPATTLSDIYALGVVLYQMLTGRVPFGGETPVEIYWKHLREQPLPPSYWRPALSPAIDHVLLRALTKAPTQRYQSVQELVDAYNLARTYTERGILTPVHLHTETVMQTPSGEQSFLPGHMRLAERDPEEVHGPGASRPPLLLRDTLPPLPMRENAVKTTLSDTETLSNEQISGRPWLQSRREKNVFLSIILSGLLCFVILPVGYLSYAYLYHHQATTANTGVPSAHTGSPKGIHSAVTLSSTPTSLPTALTSTNIILDDSLAQNTPGRWTENGLSCHFAGGAYLVVGAQNTPIQRCQLLTPSVPDDAVVQVTVALLSGDSTGMLLRLNGDSYYDFEITNARQFFFRRHDADATGNTVSLIASTTSDAIIPGTGKNTLRVEMQGNDFALFINGTWVGETHDNTYTTGQLALAASTYSFATWSEGSFTQFSIAQPASQEATPAQ